jgi:hypothetical protein
MINLGDIPERFLWERGRGGWLKEIDGLPQFAFCLLAKLNSHPQDSSKFQYYYFSTKESEESVCDKYTKNIHSAIWHLKIPHHQN